MVSPPSGRQRLTALTDSQHRGPLVAVGGVLLATLLAWQGSRWPAWQQLLVWALLLLLGAFVLRKSWPQFFGPVFLFELLRLGRRPRQFLLRCGYVIVLFLLLFLVYASWFGSRARTADEFFFDIFFNTQARHSEVARFAETFFAAFLGVQIVVCFLLTPAFTAGAIAEEKERRRLDFLLATDLSSREIVLGKLAARLTTMLALLITGLPVLSLMQLLGGVPPELLLAGFLATGATLLSLSALSMLCSVYARKVKQAIEMTYRALFAYYFLSGASWLLLHPRLQLADFPSMFGWTSPVTVTTLVQWFNSGNLLAVLVQFAHEIDGGAELPDVLPSYLGKYVLFHSLVVLLCGRVAVVRLRPVSREQAEGPAPASQPVAADEAAPARPDRPPLGDRPVLWREMYLEAEPKKPGSLPRTRWTLALSVLAPMVLVVGLFVIASGTRQSGEKFSFLVNMYLRTVCTVAACGALVAVAGRASRAIGSERDRQTLESLVLTDLSRREILWDKWLASIASVRTTIVWIVCTMAIGTLCGGLHPLAWPGLVVGWTVYAMFLASLGVWYSTISKTTQQAHTRTFLVTILACGGHLAFCSWLPFNQGNSDFLQFETLAFTPPASIALGLFHGDELRHLNGQGTVMIFWPIVGLFCYVLAAVFLWQKACENFEKMSMEG
jgi:ABC-type transport system involved in multi-copper enzyme maturation permease subunit